MEQKKDILSNQGRGTKDIHTMKYKYGNSDDTGKAEKGRRIIKVQISVQWNL